MEKTAKTSRWALWRRQIAAILRLEVRKNFTGKRSFLIYLLALLPVFIMAALVSVHADDIRENFGESSVIFANLYEGMILRTVVFFGCAWIFMNLFRGEVVDRSLHYYFLTPARREVLVVGKYLSGLVTTVVMFGVATVGSMLLLQEGLLAEAAIVRHHHERWDGAGYPDRMIGEEIPLEARIIFVADTFDAMTSDRPYRVAMSREAALDEMRRLAGSQLDPDCVALVCEVLGAPA
jgi:hypothetical protein